MIQVASPHETMTAALDSSGSQSERNQRRRDWVMWWRLRQKNNKTRYNKHHIAQVFNVIICKLITLVLLSLPPYESVLRTIRSNGSACTEVLRWFYTGFLWTNRSRFIFGSNLVFIEGYNWLTVFQGNAFCEWQLVGSCRYRWENE